MPGEMSNREDMIRYLRDLQYNGLLYAHHNPEDWDDETLQKMCLVFHPVCIRFMRQIIKVIRHQDAQKTTSDNPESSEDESEDE